MKIKLAYGLISPGAKDFEVVERKGVGHPDTIADHLAEKISIEYSKYCLRKFRLILHHNVDKVTVMGGLLEIKDWGKAKMKKPIRVLVNGRMSDSFRGVKIPIKKIIKKTVNDQMHKILPHLDIHTWLKIMIETTTYSKNPRFFKPLSVDDLPEQKNPYANDTSAVVGYWPLTPSEQLPIKLEGFFYDKKGLPKYSYIGHDIKVMVVRNKNIFNITMNIPFITTLTPTYSFYKEKVDNFQKKLKIISQRFLGRKSQVEFNLNTHYQIIKDENIKKVNGYYSGVTGSALDYGEEGVVGRGNNRKGIIPSFRTYTMEAACGKNPVYHVGKVLGLVVDTLAKEISEKFKCEAEVMIITKIADPLYTPNNLLVRTSKKVPFDLIDTTVKEILKRKDWTKRIIFEEVFVPKTNYIS